MLDFKLVQRKEMWCSESAAASVAVMFNRHYEMMFSDLWMFNFSIEDFNNSHKIGNSVTLGIEPYRIFELLEIYHGVSTKFHEISDSRELLKIAKRELFLGRPVLVDFDSLYSPWAPNFEKKNRFISAYFILDITADGLQCFDMHYLKRTQFLPMNNFLLGAKNAMLYSLSSEHELVFDWRKLLQEHLTQLYFASPNGTAFDVMRDFSQCILNELSYETEFIGTKDYTGMNDMHNVPLLKNITALCRSRGLYAMTLEYLGQKHNNKDLINLSYDMEGIGSKWALVFSIIYKGVFLSHFSSSTRNSLYKKINEIASLEEKVADSLSCIIHEKSNKNDNYGKQMREYMQINEDEKKFYYLDIKKYFNNKGIYFSIQKNYVKGLNGVGDYFVFDNFPYDSILKTSNSSYVVPLPLEVQNDNISCNGQIIELATGKYSKIMLLGYSDFMNHYETLKLRYTDCENNVPFQFTYWFYSPCCGEEKAWSGQLIRKMFDSEEEFTFTANLFSQTCSLHPNKLLKYIELPICPDIHIFAISLVRV